MKWLRKWPRQWLRQWPRQRLAQRPRPRRWNLPGWLSHGQEEDGLATALTMFALLFGMLALMLVFIPFMDSYTSRRFAQNGADAAAHAGAGRYADTFSTSFGAAPNVPYVELSTAFCTTHPVAPSLTTVRDLARQRSVQLFKGWYGLQVKTMLGAVRNEADYYASRNASGLAAVDAWVSMIHRDFNYLHQPSGETLYPVLVDAEATQQFSTWSSTLFDVPGLAAAIAYVVEVEPVVDTATPSPVFWELTEPPVPCTTWTVQYRYSWQIALVRKVPSS